MLKARNLAEAIMLLTSVNGMTALNFVRDADCSSDFLGFPVFLQESLVPLDYWRSRSAHCSLMDPSQLEILVAPRRSNHTDNAVSMSELAVASHVYVIL
jgi:hypothetical protein